MYTEMERSFMVFIIISQGKRNALLQIQQQKGDDHLQTI